MADNLNQSNAQGETVISFDQSCIGGELPRMTQTQQDFRPDNLSSVYVMGDRGSILGSIVESGMVERNAAIMANIP